MRVIYCKVGEPARPIDITGTLKSMQELVGGYIETVPYGHIRGLVCVVNEEGKLLGLPPNKIIADGEDIIVGDFFVALVDGEDIIGLNEPLERFVMSTVEYGRVIA